MTVAAPRDDYSPRIEAMGCRYAQGYHLGRPVPAEELVNAPVPVY